MICTRCIPTVELYFITGADALASILTWQDVEELFALARFVGVSRPGYDLDAAHVSAAFDQLPSDALTLLEVPALAISSTDCRARAAENRPIWYLVPDGVVQYVAKRGLYRCTSRESVTAAAEAVEMATVAARAAAAKLADNVVVIDVSDQLVITDAFVIASASNERQVNAIVDEVEEKMRRAGYKPARREGAREGRWTLLDYVEIVVHIQHEDERDFYALDRLWRDCPRHTRRSGRCRREGAQAGDAAARPDRVQRRKPDAGSARHRPFRAGPRAGGGGGRSAGQASPAADRVVGSASRVRHRRRAGGAHRLAVGRRRAVARDASGRLAGHDAQRGRRRRSRRAHRVAQRRDVGAARRREPRRRGRAQPAGGRGNR